jgi:death-on-curing protein
VVGVLYELATGLFGSAENPYPAFEIMDRGLLESALALPHQPYYETFEEKLAAMVRSIAANHALRDGNKRLALTVLHATLLANDHIYLWDDDAAESLVLRCAEGDADFRWIADFVRAWSVPIPEADRQRVPLDDPDALRAVIQGLQREPSGTTFGGATTQYFHNVPLAHAQGLLSEAEIAALLETARRVRATHE